MSIPRTVGEALAKIFELLDGPTGVSKALGAQGVTITPWACSKWLRQGRLPRTEYTGETNYATHLEIAVKGEVRASELVAKPAPPALVLSPPPHEEKAA